MNNDIGDNRFLKVLITAQRAKQIHKGARPLIQISNMRATRIALEEVERGLINIEDSSHHAIAKAAVGALETEETHRQSRRKWQSRTIVA
jgi:DNA-directed RNA polymerase omega subunit